MKKKRAEKRVIFDIIIAELMLGTMLSGFAVSNKKAKGRKTKK